MAVEIERKFLLNNDSWKAEVTRSTRMTQGYLCGNRNASIRVRLAGDDATLNIKSATLGISRLEYGYAVPPDDARELLDRLAGDRIDKTRHLVPIGPHVFEIDEFHGANAGLVVAEVELAAPDEAFTRPDWLGREVSDDPRYYNTELARHPFSQWSL